MLENVSNSKKKMLCLHKLRNCILIQNKENVGYIECKMLSGFAAISSLEVEELDVEHESGVGGNAARDALGPVTHVRTDGQLGSLAPGHLGHSLVPAGNDLGWAALLRT